mmetsp:Transcript_15187/g.32649  ORF Transcript_15187/g.32649 Transcript_15187/m.32649 type:complete len:217 (-) Transcript_15187:526-1176(-)
MSAMPSPCSADIGIASPNPSRRTSWRCSSTGESSFCAHESPSSLLATTTTLLTLLLLPSSSASASSVVLLAILPSFRSHRAVAIRSWVTPTRASHSNSTRSLCLAASSVCSIMARSIAGPSSCRCASLSLPPESALPPPLGDTSARIRSPSTPAVSIRTNPVPPILPQHSRRSRVVPATGDTMASPLDTRLLDILPPPRVRLRLPPAPRRWWLPSR